MKRIFGFSFLFILFAIMAYGITGSGACFTDSVTIEKNIITTGKVALLVSDEVRSNPDLEPGAGYQELLRFCVSNGGSYNTKWRGKLTDVSAPGGMENEILIQAIIINPDKNSSSRSDGKHDGESGENNIIWFTDKSVSELMKPNRYILMNSEPFKPNDRACFSFQAKMKGSAGDGFNQSNFAANLQLDATQWISTAEDWSK